jgi:8-oxo-dGTP pyrophosphatase MutT (NUDIX family)
LVAAKRELLEEAGIESNDWQYLGTTYSALGISNIPMAIYWARSVQLVSDERDEDEDIRNQQFMPPAQIETMAAAGDIVSTGVLSALYLMGLMKEKQ